MDPIFSAGVYLAMHSGKIAAQAMLDSLAAGDDGERRFRAYEQRVFRVLRMNWEMIEAFYTKSFMELFLQPRAKFGLPDAVTAMLAGELDGGWGMAWRRRLFFWLIRLQTRWPLVPRISFQETAC
jgi:flavin-dependent dehydrogenase